MVRLNLEVLDGALRRGARPAVEPAKALKREAGIIAKAVAHVAAAGQASPNGGVRGTTTEEALGAVRRAELALEDTRAALVLAARYAGASWAEVGALLGVSKQAAAQRYGDLDRRGLGVR